MTGTMLDYKKHFRLEFGAYSETHYDKEKTNAMVERTGGDIFLGPSTNFQGGFLGPQALGRIALGPLALGRNALGH